MTIPEMLGQSATLTLLGMCVVFAFLIVLILFMKLTHFIVHSFGWDKEKKEDEPVPVAATPASGGQDNAVIAAIAAAIKDKG